MKNKTQLILLLVFVFVSSFMFSRYLIRLNPSQPIIEIDHKSIDMGKTKRLQLNQVEFIIANKGRKDLIINGIQTRCGCTAPAWDNRIIKPMTTDTLEISYDGSDHGYFSKEIILFSNAENSPTSIFIEGVVVD